MATGRKKTVDYFPHDAKHGQTMFIVESKYGAHGYCAWFKILELLCGEGHFIDCNVTERWEFLQAKTHCDGVTLLGIINTLSNLGAIDQKLWEKKVIWSDNFIERIADVYKRRQSILPTKTPLIEHYVNRNGKNVDINGRNVDICPGSKAKQSKVKESKVKEHISADDESSVLCTEIIKDLNEKTGKEFLLTQEIKRLIKARINDGFSLEDFRKVHSNMSAVWKDDPKMDQFLRPVTLYAASKFQGYRNYRVSASARGVISESVEKSMSAVNRFMERGKNESQQGNIQQGNDATGGTDNNKSNGA